MGSVVPDRNIEVPLDGGPDCPVCLQKLDITVVTKIGMSHARTVGGDAFHQDVVVTVKVDPIRVKIEHMCEIEDRK